MSYKNHTNKEITCLVRSCLGSSVSDVRVLKQYNRLYSRMIFLEVDFGNETSRFIMKFWDDKKEFQKQLSILEVARNAFLDRADVCIPYAGCVQSENLLLMPEIYGTKIQHLISPGYWFKGHGSHVFNIQSQLQLACMQMGHWLKEWHEKTANHGDISTSLKNYLSGRENCLHILSLEESKKLYELIECIGITKTCTPHGDFTPMNVLWSPKKITVFDFGLAEWNHMSPWWDMVCMEIGLMRALRFSKKNLGFWLPSVSENALAAFRNGYGSSDHSVTEKMVCAAIRHMTLCATDLDSGTSYTPRASWHRSQLEKTLSSAWKHAMG